MIARLHSSLLGDRARMCLKKKKGGGEAATEQSPKELVTYPGGGASKAVLSQRTGC